MQLVYPELELAVVLSHLQAILPCAGGHLQRDGPGSGHPPRAGEVLAGAGGDHHHPSRGGRAEGACRVGEKEAGAEGIKIQ